MTQYHYRRDIADGAECAICAHALSNQFTRPLYSITHAGEVVRCRATRNRRAIAAGAKSAIDTASGALYDTRYWRVGKAPQTRLSARPVAATRQPLGGHPHWTPTVRCAEAARDASGQRWPTLAPGKGDLHGHI